MKSKLEFAILAPIPLEHLVSGRDIAEKTGFVAFGSNKWELFRDIDKQRDAQPVAVLIYPSYDDTPPHLNCLISWFGWYQAHVESKGGAHPSKMKHRPPTTEKYPKDNAGYWSVFWHVAGLRPLPKAKQLKISDTASWSTGQWRQNAPPRGPEFIGLPDTLADELFLQNGSGV